MHEVQKQKLHFDEEQEDHDRAPGIQEILQPVPGPHASQGDAVVAAADRRGFTAGQ
jgi:hypothetical protein